jgi:hypothetical protein
VGWDANPAFCSVNNYKLTIHIKIKIIKKRKVCRAHRPGLGRPSTLHPAYGSPGRGGGRTAPRSLGLGAPFTQCGERRRSVCVRLTQLVKKSSRIEPFK